MSLLHEKPLDIHTPEGHSIEGRFTPGSSELPHVVLAPGNGSDYDDSLIRDTARHLTDREFPTFRFNFYGGGNARARATTSLEDQVTDLETIAHFFIEEHRAHKVAALGHSLGGLAIILTRNIYDQAVLLDPSHPGSGLFNNETLSLNEQNGAYYSAEGDLRCSGAMKQQVDDLRPRMEEVAQAYTTPSLIVSAGDGVL